jgi:hypothetical protein
MAPQRSRTWCRAQGHAPATDDEADALLLLRAAELWLSDEKISSDLVLV